MKTFSAPWDRTLAVCSLLLSASAIASFTTLIWQLASGHPSFSTIFSLLALPAIVIAAVPFMIRSYDITGESILVRRLFHTTRLPIAGLASADFIPGAMKGSLRICGNGGVFSFTGWFWNRRLGHYQPYVTDLRRSVVLRYPQKTIVLSPGEPDAFIKELGPLMNADGRR